MTLGPSDEPAGFRLRPCALIALAPDCRPASWPNEANLAERSQRRNVSHFNVCSKIAGSGQGNPRDAGASGARGAFILAERSQFGGTKPTGETSASSVGCLVVEDNPHAPRSRSRLRASANETWIGFSLRTAAAYFRDLLVGEFEACCYRAFPSAPPHARHRPAVQAAKSERDREFRLTWSLVIL